MSSQPPAPNQSPSVVGVVGGLIGQVLNQPGVRESLIREAVSALTGWIRGLFNRNPRPPAPAQPVVAPQPAAVQPDPQFPDDHIPRPEAERRVTKVRIKLERVQVSRERFPQLYTEDNPFGLVPARPIQDGQTQMNWGSKFWVDLTAYDQDGHEFLRPDVLKYSLAFNTEIKVGDAFTKGLGPATSGSDQPKAGYEQVSTNAIGQGITAWLSTLGFMHQFQAFAAADRQKFTVSGSVDGMEAENPFTIGVS